VRVVSPVLVGRGAELAALQEAFGRTPSTVLIGGEGGGRSRLGAAFVESIALIENNLGIIAGASKSFSLYYETAPDEASAIAAASAVGAQAYSLGQVDTDEGKNLGKPYTAILAVNGTDLTNPPSPGPNAARLTRPDDREAVFSVSVPGTRPDREG
jgi:hypothetical protein